MTLLINFVSVLHWCILASILILLITVNVLAVVFCSLLQMSNKSYTLVQCKGDITKNNWYKISYLHGLNKKYEWLQQAPKELPIGTMAEMFFTLITKIKTRVEVHPSIKIIPCFRNPDKKYLCI